MGDFRKKSSFENVMMRITATRLHPLKNPQKDDAKMGQLLMFIWDFFFVSVLGGKLSTTFLFRIFPIGKLMNIERT